ncbi:MAG: hypothetical protein M9887_01975 [Chitinophagales bacterium]|nr:hypothetical protein [Chitinophagales bacterium]
MKLLENEEELLRSNNNEVVLTNRRIWMEKILSGQSYYIDMFLENISTVEVRYKSKLWLLIVGILCIAAGLYLGSGAIFLGLSVGAILIALWWLTRLYVIAVTSHGGVALNISAKGISESKIHDLIHDIAKAKQTRVNSLYRV